MNKQLHEVQAWLERVFGDDSVPSFEVNQHTVGILQDVMRKHQKQEKDTQLLIEDQRQKADEYAAESRRLEGVLQRLGLTMTSLSQSGAMSVRTLANLALALHTKDASETSILLGLQNLDAELHSVEESRRSQQKTLNRLKQRHETASQKHSDLTRALTELEKKAVGDQAVLEKYSRETQFIRNKTKEYRSQAQKMEAHLQKSGADPSFYHKALLEKAEALEQLKQEISPMKTKLDSYHGLPPDSLQAHVRLEELKQQVANLDEELATKMGLLQS